MEPDLSTFSDNENYLITGLTQGDPMVFRIIYQLYAQRLYNLGYYYTNSEQDAEDIVQDVFISLWSRREKIELRGSLENYITRCAKYTAFFYLKIREKKERASMHSTQSLAVNSTEEHIRCKDMQVYLHSMLASLSQKTRDIFYLNRFSGLSYTEIAMKMEISVKTVEYHISLALKKIASWNF